MERLAGLKVGAAGGPDSGAAAGSGLRMKRGSAVRHPLTGSGKHRWISVVEAICQACGGYRPGVSWRGPAVLSRGWTRMALIFSNFLHLKS